VTATTYRVSAASDRTAAEGSALTSELVERAQRGDHEAFDVLASAAYHRLYAIARRILRDGYAAEDAVQDALVWAWRDLWGLRDPEAFDGWLHRLLVRSCADLQRRTWKTRLDVDVDVIDPPAGPDEVSRLVDRDALERAFDQLSVDHRAVVVLTHYAGLTGPEVAEILAIPVGTVASRLHYALRALRVELAASLDLAIPSTEHVR
jgi:RNA polymerase sigma-70 factor, ECF subfamily